MRENKKVCAVIVTYNRRNYLKKLLEALETNDLLQGIFIFDNHGNDYTYELFDLVNIKEKHLYELTSKEKKIFYYRNDENEGGAGGFSKAIKMAMQFQWDYLWIMDDDVLPEKNCLENLLDGMDDKHKVCIPNRSDERFDDNVCIKYDLKNPFKFRMRTRVKIVPCKNINNQYVDTFAMPFEGPLISTDIIRRIGYPDPRYFIIYDDTDYCRRSIKYTQPRMVIGAILHKQIIPTKENDLSWKDYYAYRNCFVFDHKYGENFMVRNLRPWLIAHSLIFWYTLRHKSKRKIILKKAYSDYKNGNMGRTVIAEKFDDYLIRKK